MEDYDNLRVDSAKWLSAIKAPVEAPYTHLPLDMTREDMPDDVTLLKDLIEEMQFEMDLLKGINGALSDHIIQNHHWLKTGVPRNFSNPLDTSRVE